MLKWFLLFVLIFPHAVTAEFDYKISNTNFMLSQGSEVPHADTSYLYNYDRLRVQADYKEESFFATAIADGVNYLGYAYVHSVSFAYLKQIHSDTPFKTQTEFSDYREGSAYAKLYRLYGGYEDNQNRVVLGVQNIQMGVGRIWTPTNLFNPKNIYALEPDEVFGVAALSYTRHLNETSHLSVLMSQKADNSFKYGARYKTFLDFADFALDVMSSDDTKMLGYEVEGNLADTGVELRSEGAYIKNTLLTGLSTNKEREFFQGIIGADYGFVNGVTLAAEALYSSEKFSYAEMLLNLESEILPNLVYSRLYTALNLSYSFNIFLDGSLVYIESFNDKNSRFISPNITYTLNDYHSFSLGAMIQNGAKESEFGSFSNTYYFKWALSF
ncbi:hypothetical protein KKG72_02225 [bacterium]|nr:hypothetical protein [bacterium]MBU1995022.1 hypothetical protein [bacterium]